MHQLPSRPLVEVLLSGGFRLFFPASALLAAFTVGLWVPWYLGMLDVPSALPPLAWHQHELLFGFVPGVVAGFLLTAVPNWTGRPAIKGGPLLSLFLLWLAGRAGIALSGWTGLVVAIPLAIAFLPVLALMIGRELAAAGNRRNYKILVVLSVLSLAQVLFYLETQYLGEGLIACRLALSTVVLMICLVAGRIVPAFTGNWLKAKTPGRVPVPFSRFDVAVVGLSLIALLAWVFEARAPFALEKAVGPLLLATGLAHVLRQARWCPERTWREPLLAILHLGYLFVPLGFLLSGISLIQGDPAISTAGIHAWTAGSIGVMTLAVMTRASRGHTGQTLHAPPTTVWFIYMPILVSALARLAAALLPAETVWLLDLAGIAWIGAFIGFVWLYMPLVAKRM